MTTVLASPRAGPGNWLRSLAVMLRWQLTSLRLVVPVTIVVQVLIGGGFAVGIGLFFDQVPERAALYLATGVATATLLTVGVILGPQLVAQEKARGTYDFTWSLPVPRSATTAAWVLVNAVFALPGALAALLIAAARYHLHYAVSWRVVPAVGLTLLAGTLIGYAIAHAIPRPNVTQLLSQVFAFLILGFTPINFPPENLPSWLAEIHRFLPFYPMGVVVRDALASGFATGVGTAYVVIVAWTLVAMVVTGRVLGRRR